jgi:hypothetical protein
VAICRAPRLGGAAHAARHDDAEIGDVGLVIGRPAAMTLGSGGRVASLSSPR